MANTNIITELIIKVNREECNMLYCRWINEQGGISYWDFYFNNITELENKDIKVINKYVSDITTVNSNIDVTTSSQEENISVGAENLTLNQLRELNKITFCQIWRNSQWVTVSVEHKKSEAPSKYGLYKKELTFNIGKRLTHYF